MKFTYNLTEQDILTHQLFILSQSKSFQKRRAKGSMFLLLLYMITGIFIWQRNGPVMAAAFYVICLPLYFLYRKMEARQYHKHIGNYVREQYKDAVKNDLIIETDNDHITSSGGDHHQSMPWLELESITELENLYVLNFRNSNAIIFPKKNLQEKDAVHQLLVEKANALGVPFDVQVKWKWK